MSDRDFRRPVLHSDVVQAPAAAAFTPPAPTATLVGEIIWHIGDTGLEGLTPGPWLGCRGQLELISDYPDLADVVGIMWTAAFGAATPGHFRLPDLRARFPIGAGSGYSAGTIGGEAAHVLTQAEMPAHEHAVTAPYRLAGGSGGNTFQIVDASGAIVGPVGIATSQTGGGAAHNNVPPYVAIAAYVFTGRR